MIDYENLAKLLILIARLPSERMEALAGLTVHLARTKRLKEWREPLQLFAKSRRGFAPEVARVGVSLSEMLRIVAELPHYLFNSISNLAEKMVSEDGDRWYRQLVLLLRGEEAWVSYDLGESLLRPYFFFPQIGPNTIGVYELIRPGTIEEIYRSLRGGDLTKTAFSSRESGERYCRIFADRLCAIPENKAVSFVFFHGGRAYAAYEDMSSGGPIGISLAIERERRVWQPGDLARRVFLTLEHP